MIENHIAPDAFSRAIRAIHPSKASSWKGGAWGDPFEGIDKVDKVAIARELTMSGKLGLDRFSVGKKVSEIAEMIKAANSPIAAA